MSAVFPVEPDQRWRQHVASTGQTVFAVPYPFQAAADIVVVRIGLDGSRTTLSEPADYVLSGAGNPAGGSYTLTAPAQAGEIYRSVGAAVLDRVLSVVREGRFRSRPIDADLDRALIRDQELRRDADRAWRSDFGQAGGTIADIPEGHFWKRGPQGMVDGGSAADIENAHENAAAAAEDADRAEAARDQAHAAANAIATAPQWAFTSKTDVISLFEPALPPSILSVDGQIYDYSAIEPAHAGKVEDKAGNFYLLRRSPAIYLEAFRDLLDLDGPGDSTAGMSAAIGMMVQEGAGKLVFPPHASIRGTFSGRYLASNVDIDFANSIITPEDMILPSIMFGGQLTGPTYSLRFTYQRGAHVIRALETISNIAAGDFILVKDNSARLTDSAHINREVHRVAAVSGDVLTLYSPLGWKKASFATLGGTIRKIDMKENIHLSNVRTRANTGATSNVGIFAQMINNFSVDGHRHGNGAGTACQVHSCYNIDTRADYTEEPPQALSSGQGYGVAIGQGCRNYRVDVRGRDMRHTFDWDSSYNGKVTVWSEGEKGSIPIGPHNGAGGDIEMQATLVGVATNVGFNAQDYHVITGEGSSGGWPLDNIKLRGEVHIREGGDHASVGLLANTPLRSCDIDLTAIYGNGVTMDVATGGSGSAGIRMRGRNNSGRVKLVSRAFRTGFMAYESDAGATGPVPNLALDIDANVMDYATYHRYADHINIARLKGGWSVNIAYHYIQGAAVAPLRHFGIHQATYERQEDRYFALVGDPFRGGHRTGDLGTIAAPYTGLISGLADSYTITHQDMLRNGGKMLQLSGTGSITVSVENGFFVGQELVLLKGGNPSTMQMATGGNLGLGASGVVLTSGEVLSLWWSGSFWHGR